MLASQIKDAENEYMTQYLKMKHYLLDMNLLRDKISTIEDYPFNIPTIRSMSSVSFHPKVTFFSGDNGSGKSTLIEAIALGLGLNAEGGSKNFNFATRPSHSELYKFIRLTKGVRRPKDSFFFRAESFFNLATETERIDPSLIDSYGGNSLHELSHGESFLALVSERFFGQGLYILDEPEAALSPKGQLEFIVRMHDLLKQDSQFIIATHSPLILSYPDAWIYQFGTDLLERIDYSKSDCYETYRLFLNNPDRMLRGLLN